jgi:hypothetical protein
MNNGRMIFHSFARGFMVLAGISLVSAVHAQTNTPPPGRNPFGQGKYFSTKPASTAPAKKAASGEEFFIVASVDLQKSQILLKHPTEVTLLAKVGVNTKFEDENGKSLKVSDFRAGDTVWVILAGGSSGTAALQVRKGEMTVAELHRYYLDYPEIK